MLQGLILAETFFRFATLKGSFLILKNGRDTYKKLLQPSIPHTQNTTPAGGYLTDTEGLVCRLKRI